MEGHNGYFRTFISIAGVLILGGYMEGYKEFVMQCKICQQNKNDTLTSIGLLQPLLIPTQVGSDISMNFIGRLPKVKGKDTILVVVDKLTIYVHLFFALAHPYSEVDVTQLTKTKFF